jgi:hypothetical protein
LIEDGSRFSPLNAENLCQLVVSTNSKNMLVTRNCHPSAVEKEVTKDPSGMQQASTQQTHRQWHLSSAVKADLGCSKIPLVSKCDVLKKINQYNMRRDDCGNMFQKTAGFPLFPLPYVNSERICSLDRLWHR